MKTFNKYVLTEQELTKQDLDSIEKYADRLYKSVGIDVEFTRHFLDRVNDARNKLLWQNLFGYLNNLIRSSVKRLHNSAQTPKQS